MVGGDGDSLGLYTHRKSATASLVNLISTGCGTRDATLALVVRLEVPILACRKYVRCFDVLYRSAPALSPLTYHHVLPLVSLRACSCSTTQCQSGEVVSLARRARIWPRRGDRWYGIRRQIWFVSTCHLSGACVAGPHLRFCKASRSSMG